MDYDTYSANDAIGSTNFSISNNVTKFIFPSNSLGKVYIDLNPLLLKADRQTASDGQKQIMLSGWLPIFDTMHGVRGEVNIQGNIFFYHFIID